MYIGIAPTMGTVVSVAEKAVLLMMLMSYGGDDNDNMCPQHAAA